MIIELFIFVVLFLILLGVGISFLYYIHGRMNNLHIKVNLLSKRIDVLESGNSLKKEIDTFKETSKRKKRSSYTEMENND